MNINDLKENDDNEKDEINKLKIEKNYILSKYQFYRFYNASIKSCFIKINFLSSLIIFLIISAFYLRKINSINYQLFQRSLNIPKISVFMAVYNKGRYIKKCLNSIIKQTLKELEIVCVLDGSSDNSEYIIKQYQKKYKQIKLVKNDRNHGLLYSRAIGILNSNGEYLINIDADDYYEGSDNLEYLYNEAKKGNIDIIKYKVSNKDGIAFNKCSFLNQIYYQPIIFEEQFNGYSISDFYITNKMIKKDILLAAVKKINYQKYVNKHEDNIWSLVVRKQAKTMKCVDKLIYIYDRKRDSISLNKNIGQDLFDLFSHSETLNQLLNKNKKNVVALYYINLLNNLEDKFLRDNIDLKKKIIDLGENLMNNSYIYFISKKEIGKLLEKIVQK